MKTGELSNTSVALRQRQINQSASSTGLLRIESVFTMHDTRSDPKFFLRESPICFWRVVGYVKWVEKSNARYQQVISHYLNDAL